MKRRLYAGFRNTERIAQLSYYRNNSIIELPLIMQVEFVWYLLCECEVKQEIRNKTISSDFNAIFEHKTVSQREGRFILCIKKFQWFLQDFKKVVLGVIDLKESIPSTVY